MPRNTYRPEEPSVRLHGADGLLGESRKVLEFGTAIGISEVRPSRQKSRN